MKILALDIATTSGFALGTPDGPPQLGSFRCGKAFDDDTLGQRWARFANWLDDMITVHEPDLIGFEAPLVFGGASGTSRPTTLETIRLLIGLATVAELVAVQRDTDVEDAHIQQVRKHFCGTGRAKKEDVTAMCFRRGLKPADDNQADAIAILSFLQHCHSCPAPWARELPKQGGGLLIVPATTQLWKAGAQ